MTRHRVSRSGPARLAALAATLLLARVPAAGAATWSHPRFAVERPERFAVLPIEASIVRGMVNDAEPMIKESGVLERALLQSVASLLRSKGYVVDDAMLQPPALAADAELQAVVERTTSRIEEELGVMGSRPKSIREGRFGVGDVAVPLADLTGSDGLVLLRARSIIPSKGSRALSGVLSTLFGGIPYVPTTKVEVLAVIVDARSGELQAVLDDVVAGPVLKETEKVAAEAVRATFRGFPSRGERLPLTKRERRALDRAAAEPAPERIETREPEEVLAAFEEAYAKTGSDGASPADSEPEDDAAETVGEAAPWTPDGAPVSAAAAAGRDEDPAERRDVTRGAAPSEAAAAVAAGADPSAAAAWEAPAEERPAPTHQVTLQVVDGQPAGLTLRNRSADRLLVSLDLSRWIELPPDGEIGVALRPTSHRLLVQSPDGTERVRASVMVLADRVTIVELFGR